MARLVFEQDPNGKWFRSANGNLSMPDDIYRAQPYDRYRLLPDEPEGMVTKEGWVWDTWIYDEDPISPLIDWNDKHWVKVTYQVPKPGPKRWQWLYRKPGTSYWFISTILTEEEAKIDFKNWEYRKVEE